MALALYLQSWTGTARYIETWGEPQVETPTPTSSGGGGGGGIRISTGEIAKKRKKFDEIAFLLLG